MRLSPRCAISAFLFLVLSVAPVRADPVASVRYHMAGEVIHIAMTGSAEPDSRFAVASVGKTFTAVAILRLVEQGTLALSDHAAEWLSPRIVAGFDGMRGMTIEHLLRMSSGLPDYYDDAYLDDALSDPDAVQRAEVALGYAFDLPGSFAPGLAFEYSNTNYVVLGLILEAATGQDYSEALQSLVFGPSGMADSVVFGSHPLSEAFVNGHEAGRHVRAYYQGDGFGDGGAISTAQDLARFYTALFAEGALLTPRMLRAMTRDVHGAEYGMGVSVEGRIVGHSGGDLGFSSDVRMDLDTGDIAVVLIAEGDADTGWARHRFSGLSDAR